jgi:hypothetical protein
MTDKADKTARQTNQTKGRERKRGRDERQTDKQTDR